MTLVRDLEPSTSTPPTSRLGGWERERSRAAFEAIEMHGHWSRIEALFDEGLFGRAPRASRRSPERLRARGLRAGRRRRQARRAGRGTPRHDVVVDARLRGRRARPAPRRGPRGRRAATVAADAAADDVLAALAEGTRLAGHDVKELWRAALGRGVDLGVPAGDTAIAAYLLDSAAAATGSTRCCPTRPATWRRGRSDAAPATLLDDPGVGDAVLRERAAAIAAVLDAFEPRLADPVQHALYADMELPLLRVLARMEDRGIRVDAEVLRGIADELRAEAASLEVAIHEAVGHEFKINSTQQLQVVLYDELGLTKGRKTKTGFSTDAATLETLRGEHEVVDLLLRFREVDKLRSTYGESLAAEVRDDGRIHARFRQTVARTGRLSSEQPNLHNIPTRTEDGRRFRRAFLPEPTAGSCSSRTTTRSSCA